MSGKLLQKLRNWRDKRADQRGVEGYRILPNKTLTAIAKEQPKNKEELLKVHGIAEKKYQSFGKEILRVVTNQEDKNGSDEPISVGAFLQQINDTLADHTNRVSGEVVEYDIRDSYLFFTIKDPEAEASMQCFMWRRDYDLSDVELEEGLEVAVEGVPEVYKPNGRFTFQASVIELVGEGALKKAYEKLKVKLKEAGLFADERKQDLPAFPQTVGLITSQDSDAYHDFLANLGGFGFTVKCYPSRVQGAKAVKDLLEALDFFADKGEVDALIITRGGGGNLEVLQAFNNEAVVKKLADLSMPVIVGIGHEQDEPLASLAADVSVSTPTACAEILNRPWNKLTQKIQHTQTHLLRAYNNQLQRSRRQIGSLTQALEGHMETTFLSFDAVVNTLKSGLQTIRHQLQDRRREIQQLTQSLITSYEDDLQTVENKLTTYEDQINRVNPKRRLEQGYSIISQNGQVVTSIEHVALDADIDIQVADGTINAHVNDINTHHDNE